MISEQLAVLNRVHDKIIAKRQPYLDVLGSLRSGLFTINGIQLFEGEVICGIQVGDTSVADYFCHEIRAVAQERVQYYNSMLENLNLDIQSLLKLEQQL